MPLNEKLIRALTRDFGDVKVAKEGEAMSYKIVPDPVNGGKHISVQYSGEEYRICCPFCSDTRNRLWINHRWNTTDPATNYYFGVGHICCFNDGCDINQFSDRETRRKCHDMLVRQMKPYMRRGMGLQPKATKKREIKAVKLPEKCIPLDTLPDNHPAIAYLRDDRGYDPYAKAIEWQLQYCATDENPLVANRIIIPINYNGMLIGWQARYIGDKPPSDNIPKYYTMPGTPKNQLLYNYDRAKATRFGVIVEGATDVWQVGRQGVALLGSSVSPQQARLIAATWGKTGICVLVDPDLVLKMRKKAHVPTEYEKIRDALLKPGLFAWGALEVVIPQGTDPGSFTTQRELWEHIIAVATMQGYNHEILDAW